MIVFSISTNPPAQGWEPSEASTPFTTLWYQNLTILTPHTKLDTNQFAMSNLLLTHSPPCFVGFGATPHSQLSSNLSFFRGWPLLLSFFFFFLLFFFFFLLPRAKLWLFPIRSIARRSWLTLTLDKTNSFSSDDLCLEICTKIWHLH